MAPSKKKKTATRAPAKKAAPKKAPAKKAPAKKAPAGKKTPAKKAPGAAKKPAVKVKATPKNKSGGLKKTVAKIAAVLAPAVLTAVAVKSAAKKIKAPTAQDLSNVLTPLDDRILVQAEAASEVTKGGIIIPGTVDERPQRGVVVAVGRGRRNKKGVLRPIEINVGETVMFAEAAGSKVTIANTELLIVREDEILGVVG